MHVPRSLLAVSLISAFFMSACGRATVTSTDTVKTETSATSVPTLEKISEPVEISWNFIQKKNDAMPDAPETQALLVLGGSKQQMIDLGSYLGEGTDTRKPTAVQPDNKGAILGAVFWYAGGGDELEVYNESGSLLVKHRIIDEQSGLGDWQELQKIELEPGTKVTVKPL
ncbi:MAG: hypothetical protein JWM56_604 [Candidatus Peribacteria bacterium]|nr:hypothetical protein [Candidatus Peribacteria bacterium]